MGLGELGPASQFRLSLVLPGARRPVRRRDMLSELVGYCLKSQVNAEE